MSCFLLLTFSLLIQPSFQISESDTFLINYEQHNLCMLPSKSSGILLHKCNKDDKNQNFKWTSNDQLLNLGLKLCLGASADFRQLEFSSCNQTSEHQKWACVNDTFPAIIRQNWFLSYVQGHVQLNSVPDVKALWKIHGTKDNLCATGFDAQFTLQGNSQGAPCFFPFKYKNDSYVECTTVNSENHQPWCGTTANVDEDSLVGYCPLKGDNDEFWIKDPWTGDRYQINSDSALSWLQARKSCQQQNAELLSITELHEHIYLAGLTRYANTDYWIGLNSLDMDSGWQWVGNHPVRYVNWAPGSPSPESEKICATMQSQSGKWENKMCDHRHGYICKRGNSSLNTPVISSDDLKPVKCPAGWVPYSGHCYILLSDLKSWNGAKSACRKEHGDLASIHNIEEHDFVISQLGYRPTHMLWIGLNAQRTERYFEWSDGTRVTFTKWQRGEPTYLQDTLDNCVIMTGENGYWMDTLCQEEYASICKREPLETLSEAEDVDLGCQRGWKRHGYYCYLPGQTMETFSQAKKSCEGKQGSLVFIEDRYEQAYLTSLVGLRPEKYFWIGISEITEGQPLNWTNGAQVRFSHWNSGMPGQNHGCAAMRTGTAAGLWDVVSCEEKAVSLCKRWAEGATTTPAPTTTPLRPCPEGWTEGNRLSSCFKVFKAANKYRKKTWFEAQDFCREMGADLASIHNSEDQGTIRTSISGETWIGLSALDSDTGFTWNDGSPVDFERWFPWDSDSTVEGQQCTVISPFFYWGRLSCLILHDWACQVYRGVTLKAEPKDPFDRSHILIEDGWVKFEDNDNEYYFSNTTMSMGEARKFCKQQSGDLAVITSGKEREQLWKYNVFRAFKSDVYIGLTVGPDGKFQWLDGTLVTYAAWAPGEPNNGFDEEDCVLMYAKTGLWNDINCSAKKHFICERHNSSVRSTIAPTSPAPQGGCAASWHLFNNQCFQIFGFNEEERKPWKDSKTACKDLEGNLATIPSRDVQAFLTMHLKDISVDVWIGLHDQVDEGKFLWTDGSSVHYTNWVSGAPSYRRWNSIYRRVFLPAYSGGDCVTMIKKPAKWAGYWKDRSCAEKYGYVCQKNSDPVLPHSEATIPASGHISYGNSSYSFTQKTTWAEARKACQSKHSELTSILNPYSQSFLSVLVLTYQQPVWIGLNSNVTNEIYKWVSDWKLVYTNWAPGEPRKALACVYLDLDGQWKTGACNETYLAVCEQYNGIRPTDHPQVHGICPESQQKGLTPWIPFRSHCYRVILDQMDRPSASMKCSQLGGSLTSIEDVAELKFLMEHMQNFDPISFWIGLLQNIDGEWIWEDHTAVDFVNWNTEESQNDDSADYYLTSHKECVAMNSDTGKWFSISCRFPSNGFICKTHKILEAKPTTAIPKAMKEDSQSAHHTAAVVVILCLIIAAAGITSYIFYKRRRRQQLPIAGFHNSLYHDKADMLQNNAL